MATLGIESEIGVLKRLVLHTPGPEIEAMTPAEAEQDLYNDIIPLGAVRKEYDRLHAFLDLVTKTYELVDLLTETLADAGDRFDFLSDVARHCPIRSRLDKLMALKPADLARLMIRGIPAPEGSLSSILKTHSFSSRPLPNAYFMRDSAAIIGDCLMSAATAYDVRLVESIITRFIFTRHPDFKARAMIFDGPAERNRYVTAEGGDILVLGPRTMAIGVSERTTPAAVETIARNTARLKGESITVFAVELPRERATIHLDMVFTMIDRDAALVYAPIIQGELRKRVIRIDADPEGRLVHSEAASLLEGLRDSGLDLEPVACGGGMPLYQEREQWLSGSNSFAFAPGKILTYSCNSRTLDALDSAGFSVVPAGEFISGNADAASYKRLAVSFDGIELARGGGGARCMTLPVEREPL